MNRYDLFILRKGKKLRLRDEFKSLKGPGIFRYGFPDDLEIWQKYGVSYVCSSKDFSGMSLVLKADFIRGHYE